MSLIRKLRDRLQGATLHDLWVETRWVLHHSKRYRRSMLARFGFNFYDIFVYAFCILFALVCVYPMCTSSWLRSRRMKSTSRAA